MTEPVLVFQYTSVRWLVSADTNSPFGETQEALKWLITYLSFGFFFLQIEYTIHRNNKGLGINIAGGKGSTPYIGSDEVGRRIVL